MFSGGGHIGFGNYVTPKDTGLGTIAKSLEHALGYIWVIFGVFRLIGVKYP